MTSWKVWVCFKAWKRIQTQISLSLSLSCITTLIKRIHQTVVNLQPVQDLPSTRVCIRLVRASQGKRTNYFFSGTASLPPKVTLCKKALRQQVCACVEIQAEQGEGQACHLWSMSQPADVLYRKLPLQAATEILFSFLFRHAWVLFPLQFSILNPSIFIIVYQ